MADTDYIWALKTGDLDEVKAKVQTVKKKKNAFPFFLSLLVNRFPGCLAPKLMTKSAADMTARWLMVAGDNYSFGIGIFPMPLDIYPHVTSCFLGCFGTSGQE